MYVTSRAVPKKPIDPPTCPTKPTQPNLCEPNLCESITETSWVEWDK